MGLFPESSDGDEWRALVRGETSFRPPIGSRLPGRYDLVSQIFNRGAFAKGFPEIEAGLSVQAEIPEAVSWQPAAVATPTERLGR